jgi:hypothetical protein
VSIFDTFSPSKARAGTALPYGQKGTLARVARQSRSALFLDSATTLQRRLNERQCYCKGGMTSGPLTSRWASPTQ